MTSVSSAADQLSANDPFIIKAYQLLAQNKLQEVATLLNEAQRNTPYDPRIFMLGARLAEQSDKPNEAVEAMEHATRLAPQWWPAQLEYGLLLARLDRNAQALAQAEKIFALESRERMALAGLIDIAVRCGDMAQAVRYTEHALTHYPNDPVLLMNLARTQFFSQQYEAALSSWGAVLAQEPANMHARYGRMRTLLQVGRNDEALEDAQQLLAHAPDDAVYRYFAQVAQGQTPPTQPVALQEELFGGLARQYDLHMVRYLRYELPQQTAEKILEIFPDRRFNLLDLGCGTGLLGVCLGRIDGGMVGVDASESMIAQAARHHVYDKFHKVNLLDAVRDTPDALYEVIAALDVFPYVGDLQPVLGNVHRILQPEGFFFFSTEAAPEPDTDYALQASTGRYVHGRAYLERLLEQAGFALASIEEKTLRYEAGEPVAGFVVTAQKGR